MFLHVRHVHTCPTQYRFSPAYDAVTCERWSSQSYRLRLGEVSCVACRVVESEDFLGFRLHPINCSSSKNRLRLPTFLKPTPTPASLKTRLIPPTPIPAILKKRLRLQLKTCDSANSDSRLHNPNSHSCGCC